MRVLLYSVLLIGLAACQPIYTRDIANLTSFNNPYFPEAGISEAELLRWFDENDYSPGQRVLQSEAELRRMQGEPLVYANPQDRTWWESRIRTVRDFCATQKFVYYRLDETRRLDRAIQTYRSGC